MASPLSLLRRERDRGRPCRQAAAWLCAALTLALPGPAAADALQPDPPATPAPIGLQPDTFPPTPTPAPEAPRAVTHVVPVQGGEAAVPALATTPVEKPPAASVVVPAAPKPVAAARATTPIIPSVAHVVARQKATKAHHAAARRDALPRLRLPVDVGETTTMRLGLLARVEAVAVTPAQRDLVPAALALLALVVTSGCFLAVAARHRREGLRA